VQKRPVLVDRSAMLLTVAIIAATSWLVWKLNASAKSRAVSAANTARIEALRTAVESAAREMGDEFDKWTPREAAAFLAYAQHHDSKSKGAVELIRRYPRISRPWGRLTSLMALLSARLREVSTGSRDLEKACVDVASHLLAAWSSIDATSPDLRKANAILEAFQMVAEGILSEQESTWTLALLDQYEAIEIPPLNFADWRFREIMLVKRSNDPRFGETLAELARIGLLDGKPGAYEVAPMAAFEGGVARWQTMNQQLESLGSWRMSAHTWVETITPQGLSVDAHYKALGGSEKAQKLFEQAIYAWLMANGRGSTPCAQLASLGDEAWNRFLADARKEARTR
jgi:hypothetical protein